VWASPRQLRGQVEENLRQLGLDHLDVVNLRLPGSTADSSIAEHFGALAGLRDAGLVRHPGPDRQEREDVLAVARAHDASAAQVRLAWTLQQGPHVLAIPGTGNPDHLEANVAAGALRLAPEEMARLDGWPRPAQCGQPSAASPVRPAQCGQPSVASPVWPAR